MRIRPGAWCAGAASCIPVLRKNMITADELAPLRGKKVVIADHQPHSRGALREMVSLLGATTIINANNASDVLRQARARSIDLILCDYQLDGERDGQQLLEELRNTRQIPLATMFMMITGERSYQKVVAVAEFAPDDYLLKPFTAGQLQERIAAVAVKKRVFERAYALMESGKLEQSLAECTQIRSTRPQYAADALRLMIETMLTLKRHEEAEALLLEVVAQKLVPWAAMGLARIQHAEGLLVEAETGLAGLAASNPEYLGAKDLLAQVKEDLGKPEEALEVLESAGAGAQNNVSRLRRAGLLAAQTGDHKKASVLLEKVVGRVRNSTLAKPEDFVALADAYMEQGRTDQAERVCAEQRRTMRDTPDATLVSKLMEFQRYRRDPAPASQERANAALEALLEAHAQLRDGGIALTAAVDFDVFNACFQSNRHEPAAAIGEHLMLRADASGKLVERVTALMAQIRLDRARIVAIVPLDQVLAMLARLMARGWDEAVGHACRGSVAHWGETTPDDARLPAARERLVQVLQKYGFNARSGEAATIAA